jgi:hypothetical protein
VSARVLYDDNPTVDLTQFQSALIGNRSADVGNKKETVVSPATAKPQIGLSYKTIEVEVEVEVNLRPTVSRPVCLGVGLPSGVHDQIFVFCLTIAGFLMCGALSDERTVL